MKRVIKICLECCLCLIFLLVVAFLVVNGKVKNNYNSMIKDPIIAYDFQNEASGKELTLSLEKGDYYAEIIKDQGLFDYVVIPLIAVWLEDSEGEYMETLFVSSKALEINRPSALPVWSHKAQMNTMVLPDDVSGASNKDNSGSFNPSITGFRIVVEINRSYDYNTNYKKDVDFNGQPSLIYEAVLKDIEDGGRVNLTLIGHGSINGDDGEINVQLDKITTAKEIFKGITLSEMN